MCLSMIVCFLACGSVDGAYLVITDFETVIHLDQNLN